MLNKVLKKMKAEGKLSVGNTTSDPQKYPSSKQSSARSGFHAKANSQQGAERQRSMGNRMQKPSSPSK